MRRFTTINENVNIKELSTGKWVSLTIENAEVFNDIKNKLSVITADSKQLILLTDVPLKSLIEEYNKKIEGSNGAAGIEREYINRLGYVNRILEYFNNGYNVVFVNLKISY